MTSFSIVEDFDVIEDICTGKIAGFVDAFPDPFFLQAAEEGFGDGVGPAVAAPAHAGLKVVCPAEPLPIITPILASLVRVHDHGLCGFAPRYRHENGIEDDFLCNDRLHGPSDDTAFVAVHDDSQIQPALQSADVGNVGDPGLAGSINRKFTLELVGRENRGRPAIWRGAL